MKLPSDDNQQQQLSHNNKRDIAQQHKYKYRNMDNKEIDNQSITCIYFKK